MGSKTTPFLPTIDLSKNYYDTLICGTEERKLLCQSVRKALEDYGFLVVKYDKISDDEKEEMFEGTRSLMDLPTETKLKHASMSPYYPYVPPTVVAPYYESFGVMNTWLPENALEFTQLMWPDGNDKFCQIMSTLSNKALDLVRTLLDVICDGYGVERQQDFHVDNTDTLLRLAKYTAPMREEPVIGLTPHIDGNYLTLLCNNEVEGLTFKFKDERWFEVNPGKGSFVLFVGQALKAWSNGRLHAPLHKVTISREKDRFMCGLFFFPKGDQIVQPHQGFVDEEHPAVFKPFVYREFLDYSLKTGAVEGTLESFAGI